MRRLSSINAPSSAATHLVTFSAIRGASKGRPAAHSSSCNETTCKSFFRSLGSLPPAGVARPSPLATPERRAMAMPILTPVGAPPRGGQRRKKLLIPHQLHPSLLAPSTPRTATSNLPSERAQTHSLCSPQGPARRSRAAAAAGCTAACVPQTGAAGQGQLEASGEGGCPREPIRMPLHLQTDKNALPYRSKWEPSWKIYTGLPLFGQLYHIDQSWILRSKKAYERFPA